jgi:hypothetical protein
MSLKIYSFVLDLVGQVSPLIRVVRARSAALADQMERALIGIPLNVAEGAYSRGEERQARYQSAAASVREMLAWLQSVMFLPRHGARFHVLSNVSPVFPVSVCHLCTRSEPTILIDVISRTRGD